MAISYERIPSNIRVPLFYVEVSGRQASYFAQQQVALLFGPMLATGVATPLQPVMVTAFDDAVGLFGAGSILADMVDLYRRNDNYGELWCIPHEDPAAGTAAFFEASVDNGNNAAGSVYLYVNGDRIVTNIPAGSTDDEIAAAVVAAVNAQPFCAVAAATGTTSNIIRLTAKNVGTIGNQITVALNLRGVAGGERLPPGMAVTVTSPMGGGVGEPPLTEIIAAMGDDEYDFVGSPYCDAASLDQLDELMNDVSGRWAWDRQIYGGVFTAMTGTAADLTTFGRTRNGPHVYVLGYAQSPSPPWRRTAALTAEAAVGLRQDPARPLQTLPLVGVLPTPRGAGFTVSEKNTLLYSGIGIEMQDLSGQVRLQRVISTYQRNAWNQPDPSWLDVQTAYTLMYIIRFLRQRLLQKFPRHKLADDGTPFGPGQAIATPGIIRGELIAAYSEMQEYALVENMTAFKQHLIVERNATDPNRVDILFPPDLINQLRILAMLVEFRLQYPSAPAGSVAAAA